MRRALKMREAGVGQAWQAGQCRAGEARPWQGSCRWVEFCHASYVVILCFHTRGRVLSAGDATPYFAGYSAVLVSASPLIVDAFDSVLWVS